MVRTSHVKAEPGVHRITWDLRMNGFRNPMPQGQTRDPEADPPAGPEVLPGTYTLRAVLEGDTLSTSVTVKADPRFDVTAAERRANLDMQLRAGRLQNVATETVDRIRATRKSIEAAAERLKQKGDDDTKALQAAGDSLKDALNEVEEMFVGRQDVQGFVDSPRAVMARLGNVGYALESSWEAPTAAAAASLEQAEQLLRTALARYNAVVDDDVAAYARRVQAAGVEVFTSPDPMTLNWTPASAPRRND